MRTIGYGEALDLLNRAVEDKGDDYVYTNEEGQKAGAGADCVYFHGSQPGCLIGHVFSYIGIRREDLLAGYCDATGTHGDDYNLDTGINQPSFQDYLRESLNVEFTDRAADLLTRAQSFQDGGGAWGQAVSGAVAVVDS